MAHSGGQTRSSSMFVYVHQLMLHPKPVSRCECDADQIGDGYRCYGNIMDRLIELDLSGSQRHNLSGAVALFGKKTKTNKHQKCCFKLGLYM